MAGENRRFGRIPRAALVCIALLCVVRSGFADETEAKEKAKARVAAQAEKVKKSFADTVNKNFRKWDRNWDGLLTATEVDRLINDPSVKGKEAAAIAAIHRYLRGDKAPAKLTLADILRDPPKRKEGEKGTEPARFDEQDTTPHFANDYGKFVVHLVKAPRELFTSSDGPSRDGVAQGRLGDCYFVSVVGALVTRSPETLRKMFEKNADDSVDIHFPTGATAHVGPLTDAEIALTSSAADQGIWINVLEKGFSVVHVDTPQGKAKHHEDDIELDTISRGGKPNLMIQLVTGHKASIAHIRKLRDKKYAAPTNAEVPALVKRFDTLLAKNLDAHHLVCCDVASYKTPPGILGHHAYAVLAYDRKEQVVTVWNPHGKDFKPKETPAGLTHGYPIHKGVFEIPLKEFVRVFRSVHYETEADLPSQSTEPSRPAASRNTRPRATNNRQRST